MDWREILPNDENVIEEKFNNLKKKKRKEKLIT